MSIRHKTCIYKLNTNIKSNNLGKLSLLHTNICSLQGGFSKLEEVLLDNLEHELDIVALTETWHDKDNVTFTPGLLWNYQKYEGTPGSSKRAACGLYFKDSIPLIVRTDLNKTYKNNRSEFETFWIEIVITNSGNLLVGVIYRHPKPKDVYFMKHFGDILKTIAKETKTLY